VAAFFGFSQKHEAEKQKRAAQEQALAAQHALTDSFFRTIGVSKERVEREALWELAQLDRANAGVRRELLNRWFGTADAFMRGAADDGRGLRAATGLNVEYHRLVTSIAAELGRRLAAAMENPQQTNPIRLSGLGNALAALVNKMEPQTVPRRVIPGGFLTIITTEVYGRNGSRRVRLATRVLPSC
jgi:hypothetical protein